MRSKPNKMKELYTALDALTGIIIEKMFKPTGYDVGLIAILIHRKKGAYGYCYIDENWKIGDNKVREIGITDSCIIKGLDRIITTTTHELIHSANSEAGVKDCSGMYHNHKFSEGCDRVGLIWEQAKTYGVITPDQHPAIFDDVIRMLPEKHKNIIDSATVILDQESKKGADRNMPVHQCPECGAKARATAKTSLICADCDTFMAVR